MNDWSASIGESRRAAETAGWVIAAAIVVTAHVAGGYWLSQAAESPRDPGAEQPLIVEISLEAAAPDLPDAEPDAIPDIPMVASPDLPVSDQEMEDIAEPDDPRPIPDQTEPDQLAELTPDLLPEVEAPPEPLPEPVAEPVVEPDPEPLPEPDLPVVENAEVALAPAVSPRPQPRPKKEEPQKTTRAPPAERNTRPAKVDAPKKADAPVAPAAKQGTPAPQVEQTWNRDVNSRVVRHMSRWTNSARKAVSFHVVIQVDGGGRVVSVQIQGSTGDPSADASLRAHAGRIPALKATPDGKGRSLKIPVRLGG